MNDQSIIPMNISILIKHLLLIITLVFFSNIATRQDINAGENTIVKTQNENALEQTRKNEINPEHSGQNKSPVNANKLPENFLGKEVTGKNGESLKGENLLSPTNNKEIKNPDSEKPVIVTDKDCPVT